MGYENSSDCSVPCRFNLEQSWMVKKQRSWSPLPFSEYHSSSSVPCRLILYSYFLVNLILPNDNTNWISMKWLMINDKRLYKLSVQASKGSKAIRRREECLPERAQRHTGRIRPACLAIVASASSSWQPYPVFPAIVLSSHFHQSCIGPQLRRWLSSWRAPPQILPPQSFPGAPPHQMREKVYKKRGRGIARRRQKARRRAWGRWERTKGSRLGFYRDGMQDPRASVGSKK
jgi:hypothetical protein